MCLLQKNNVNIKVHAAKSRKPGNESSSFKMPRSCYKKLNMIIFKFDI